MSIERNIEGSDNVFQYERKDLIIPVGDAVDDEGNVTGSVDLTQFTDLEWTIRNSRGSRAVVRKIKTTAGIAIEDAPGSEVGANDAARVVLQPEDLGIDHGVYFHSLRELDGGNLLVHGRFVLNEARDPDADPH